MGFHKQATIGDVVMSLFLLWGPPIMTGDGPKMVHFGPKMAKHGRLVNVPKWPKRVERGPKWSSQVFLIIWDPFGPMTFLPHMDKVGFGGGAPEQKINIFNHMKKTNSKLTPVWNSKLDLVKNW